ncbi:hypothetical protein BH11BAC3_BH11BAC3_28340 [soil metagenome]
MNNSKKTSQYSIVSVAAYEFIIAKNLSPEDAWKLAAEKNIKSVEGRKKGCTRAAFLGLCDHGHLKNITGSNSYESKNYNYAKFAAEIMKTDPTIPKRDSWLSVQNKFKTSASHQGQLDVVIGLLEFMV